MSEQIQQKLDTLAEFYAQKDVLEMNKRALLDEVKVPEEIEQIVKEGMTRQGKLETATRSEIEAHNYKLEEEKSAITIPEELKSALADIDRQRAEIMAKFQDVEKQRQAIEMKKHEYAMEAMRILTESKQTLLKEIEAQTAKVYSDIAERKNEIEIEFSGKADDVNENIAKLEAEIKEELKKEAAEKLARNPKAKDLSVKGKFFHAVYVPGRITWNNDKMEDWIIDHPFLREARKQGEPSITLRKI